MSVIAQGSEIVYDIGAGEVSTVNTPLRLDEGTKIVKRGDGKLVLPEQMVDRDEPLPIEVEAGSLELTESALFQPPAEEIPVSAYGKIGMWLDASDPSTMVTTSSNGQTFVEKWFDRRSGAAEAGDYFYAETRHDWSQLAPEWKQCNTIEKYNTITNSILGVWFGGLGSGQCMALKTVKGDNLTAQPVEFFAICGVSNSWGHLLGHVSNTSEVNPYFWWNDIGATSLKYPYMTREIWGPTSGDAALWLDGKRMDQEALIQKGNHLVNIRYNSLVSRSTYGKFEMALYSGASCSTWSNLKAYKGGDALCELLYVTNKLTTTERRKITSYLMRKWFGVRRCRKDIKVAKGATVEIEVTSGKRTEGIDFTIEGEGKFVKRGAGELVINPGTTFFTSAMETEIEGGSIVSARPLAFEVEDGGTLAADVDWKTSGVNSLTTISNVTSALTNEFRKAGSSIVAIREVPETTKYVTVDGGTLVISPKKAIMPTNDIADVAIVGGDLESYVSSTWKFGAGVKRVDYSSIARQGRRNGSDYNGTREDDTGKYELLFMSNSVTAWLTFTPPKGTWYLKADIARWGSDITGNNILHAYLEGTNETNYLGRIENETRWMRPYVWAESFEADGSTSYRVRIVCAAPSGYNGIVADSFRLTANYENDHELLRNTDFEMPCIDGNTSKIPFWTLPDKSWGAIRQYGRSDEAFGTGYGSGDWFYELQTVTGVTLDYSETRQKVYFPKAGRYRLSMLIKSRVGASADQLSDIEIVSLDEAETNVLAHLNRLSRGIFEQRIFNFSVPSAGERYLQIRTDHPFLTIDDVSLKYCREQPVECKLPENIVFDCGNGVADSLHLDFVGTNTIKRFTCGSYNLHGYLSAQNCNHISGEGVLYVPPIPEGPRYDTTQFQIGMYSFPKQFYSEKYIKELKEIEVDFLTSFPYSNWRILDMLQDYGISVFASGYLPGPAAGGQPYSGRMREIRPWSTYVTKFEAFKDVDHPAFQAIVISDEPSAADMEYLGEVAALGLSKAPDTPVYINLFPNYASVMENDEAATENQLGTKTYKEHIDVYSRTIPLGYISYDHYMIYNNVNTTKKKLHAMYENYRIVADECRRTGREFWYIPQANSHTSDKKNTTENQLRFQAYTSMAYGATRISWACWVDPPYGGWWSNNVYNATTMTRNEELYQSLKVVNREIHSVGRRYMKYLNTATRHVRQENGGAAYGDEMFTELQATDNSPLVVGEMVARDGSGKRAVFVVATGDVGDTAKATHTLCFRARGKVTAFCSGGETVVSEADDGTLQVPIVDNGFVMLEVEPEELTEANEEEVVIEVNGGETTRVSSVVLPMGGKTPTLRKRGDGQLELFGSAISGKARARILVESGTVKLKPTKENAVVGCATLSNALRLKPALWLDAYTTNSLVMTTNGVIGVQRWNDVRDDNTDVATNYIYAVADNLVTTKLPVWRAKNNFEKGYHSMTSTLPGVYFGGYMSGVAMALKKPNGAAVTDQPFEVFAVHCISNSWGCLIGNVANSKELNPYCWAADEANKSVERGYVPDCFWGPTMGDTAIWVDGERWEPSARVKRGFQLYDLRRNTIMGERNFGNFKMGLYSHYGVSGDASGCARGGDVLCEYLYFTNAVSASERAEITDYLMRKWFGRTTAPCDITLAKGARLEIEVDAGEIRTLDANVTGEGEAVKIGDGELVFRPSAYPKSLNRVPLEITEGSIATIRSTPLKVHGGEDVVADYAGDVKASTTTVVSMVALSDAKKFVKSGDAMAEIGEFARGIDTINLTDGRTETRPRSLKTEVIDVREEVYIRNHSFEEWSEADKSKGSIALYENYESCGWKRQNWGAYLYDYDNWLADTNNVNNAHSAKITAYGFERARPPDGNRALHLKQCKQIVSTEVEIEKPGKYELSYMLMCRSGSQLGKVWAWLEDTNGVMVVDFGFQSNWNYCQFWERVSVAMVERAGKFRLCLRNWNNGTDHDISSIIDDIHLTRVGDCVEVWKIPGGDFENCTNISIGSMTDAIITNWVPPSWKLLQSSTWTKDEKPSIGLAMPRTLGQKGYYVGSGFNGSRLPEGSVFQLLMRANGSGAETTFVPPQGKWYLKASLGVWGNGYERVRKLSVSANNQSLGAVTIRGRDMRDYCWPIPIVSDGQSAVVLKLTCVSLSGYFGISADDFMLVREYENDNNLIVSGDFEVPSADMPSGWYAVTPSGWIKYNGHTDVSRREYGRSNWAFGTDFASGDSFIELRQDSAIGQTVDFPVSGWYQLSFLHKARQNASVAPLNVELVEGNVTNRLMRITEAQRGCYAPKQYRFYVATPGNRTLWFRADTPKSDIYVCIDDISLRYLGEGTRKMFRPRNRIMVSKGAELQLDFSGVNKVRGVSATGSISGEGELGTAATMLELR